MTRLRVAEGTYLPPDGGTLGGKWFRWYLRLAYNAWRRILRRFLRGRESHGAIRLLDCGCGPGFLLAFCNEWFPALRLLGMDLDRQVLRYARSQAASARLMRASVSAPVLPLRSGTCDVVMALHVVEHLEEPDQFLAETRRLLRDDGLLVLATPNPAGLGARIMGQRWTGWRPDHISLRPPREWRTAVERAGFRIQEEGTTGLTGIPLFHHTPLALLNWVPLFIWGFFPWHQGEAYVCVARAT